MTLGERQKLLRRIRQIRRSTAAREQHEQAGYEQAAALAEPGTPGEDADRVRALERRVAHLERLLEGLQDSVHREFERRDELIEQLQRDMQPAALSAALAQDARKRGL